MKKSDIQIVVSLDESQVPEKIEWQASDHPDGSHWHEAKAMMVSFFDKDHRDTLRFDLWTKEMQVQEMDRMVYYTLRSMADSYVKATGNSELGGHLQQFAQYFGQQTEIIKKES